MSAFAQWLMGQLTALVEWLYNAAIDLLQGLIDLIPNFIMSLLSLFPDGSGMPSLPSMPESSTTLTAFLSTLNWVFPLAYVLQLFGWLSVSMLMYFALAPLFRWAKLLN